MQERRIPGQKCASRAHPHAAVAPKGGQKTAVAGAFQLAGYNGQLRTLRVDDPTERIFVLPDADLVALREVRTVEQVVGQVLGCKVAIIAPSEDLQPLVPFE